MCAAALANIRRKGETQMFEGKMKAVTFSYDDGVTQDKEILEMYKEAQQ